jgi:hypothetical protein
LSTFRQPCAIRATKMCAKLGTFTRPLRVFPREYNTAGPASAGPFSCALRITPAPNEHGAGVRHLVGAREAPGSHRSACSGLRGKPTRPTTNATAGWRTIFWRPSVRNKVSGTSLGGVLERGIQPAVSGPPKPYDKHKQQHGRRYGNYLQRRCLTACGWAV